MSGHLIVNGLAHAAVGGTIILAVGFLAIISCRQPIRRIRLIELTLLGALIVPIATQLPWLPHWSMGFLQLDASNAQPPEADVVAMGPNALGSEPFVMTMTSSADEAEHKGAAPDRHRAAALPTAIEAPSLSVAGWIAVGYGLVVSALIGWYAAGILSLFRLYRSTKPVPEDVLKAFRAIAGPAGDAVSLRSSDRVELPFALRGWRPIIVLPSQLCSPDNDAALQYSLAHEWSHIEGGDVSRWYWTSLVQFIYFFHPLFWWLRRQLRLCQDYLADARAAEHAGQAEDYAEYLVGLAQRRVQAPLATLGIGDSRSNLYRRIIMLLQTGQTLERRCVKTWTAGTILCGIAVVLLSSSIRLDAGALPQAAGDKKAEEKKPEPPKEAAPAAEQAETLQYSGRVVDKETGKPISGVIVTVRRSLPDDNDVNSILQETKHTTDEGGKYSFTIPPEQTSKRRLYIELDVEHPDYAPRAHFGYALGMIRKNEKLGGRPFFEHVEMRPGKAITGTVRTNEGQPAAGVRVQAYSVTNNRQNSFEYGSFTDCRTDAKGEFRLVVTTPGAAVLWLLPENYAPSTHRVPDEKRGDLETFTVGPGISIKGKVLDVRGKPLANVNVNAQNRGGSEELQGLMVADMMNRSAVTNENGEFAMKPLPPGEYELLPSDHARDGSAPRNNKRYEVPGVFLRQRVVLKQDIAPLEIRAVPHVVIEAQYYDGKGKKSRGFAGHVFGQIDKSSWFAQTKIDGDGKMSIFVPHGLENVRLSLMTNEHGALRFRVKKDQPLASGREIELGTLNDDVRGIEIVHYKAPIVVVNAVDKDKRQITGFKPQIVYANEGLKRDRRGQFINGIEGDVYLEKQEDGRWHTSQLLPDEKVTVTVHATNYESKSLILTLPEGEVREIELVMDKGPEKK